MSKTVADLAKRWLRRAEEDLTESESRVLKSALERRSLTKNAFTAHETSRSFGARTADGIARIGGSWGFILSFLAFLVVWTIGNTILLGREIFDPYPFIFLNLLLSMLAAIQAPIIMMSQNRQAERDRTDAAHDYEVNLKAEIEIMALHEKFDEIRFQEILLMRNQIEELTSTLKRMETLLAAKTSQA
ncbi:DUF1003 domain-containing protein [Foliimonas ilicis]